MICTPAILSNPGNHTWLRSYSLVLVLPGCPSCASQTTFWRRYLGTTIRVPRTIVRGTRIVVPKYLRQKVVWLAHEGHPGNTKTKE